MSTLDKSIRCGCGVSLMAADGKVPRRRVVKLSDDHKLHIVCPHCNGATCLGVVGPPPEEERVKKSRVKIVYIPNR